MTKVLQYYKQVAKRSFNSLFEQYLFYMFSRDKKEGICLEDFICFPVDQSIIDEYVHEYWQMDSEYLKKGKWKLSIKEIDDSIYKWKLSNKITIKEAQDYYVNTKFKEVFPFDKFEKLFKKDSCHYCGITEEKIREFIFINKIFKKKLTRGWSLEIDRLEPNLEYTDSNCVRCCYWCNSAKTDEFNEEDFKPIGEAIKNIWHGRLTSK